MKKGTLIAIMVIVFIIIGVTIYLFMQGGKKQTETVTSEAKTQTGLGNILANTDAGTLASLLKLA